ncbi:MAG: hypothetical protein JWQ97_2188 [Phenylobacterium sp.]|nr:hypothetical protein [Phenylobacterium sp.]
MSFVDFLAVAAAPVRRTPFEHMLVDCALRADSAAAIDADYPCIAKSGSFAVSDLDMGPAVRGLISELGGTPFRELMAAKFEVDLEGKPAVFTLRGACAARDGKIHTDSRSKIISILIYLNSGWQSDGGRLRLLRDGRDLENYAVEIEPTFGRMLAFRRSERSWHGHHAYRGPRRVLQMNYVTSANASFFSEIRHRVSALAK